MKHAKMGILNKHAFVLTHEVMAVLKHPHKYGNVTMATMTMVMDDHLHAK